MIDQKVERASVLGLPIQKRSVRELMMQPFHKLIRSVAAPLLFAVLTVLVVGDSMADGGLLAQTPTPVTNVVSGRSFTVEIGIVVVMFGGALFAVCRSSNRT
jgi:formate/nitrite transporter FocA (FNT family)